MTPKAKTGLRWRPRLLGLLGRVLLNFIFSLNRITVQEEEHLTAARTGDRPVFIGFWHGRMIYPLWYLRRYRPMGLVSRSRDGDILASLLQSWGYVVFRASSTRGGRGGLLRLMRHLDQPHTIITNAMDGPVGPAKVAKVGGLAAAARKNAVLIPVSGAASRRWIFRRSWDHFQIPRPFGRIVIRFGPSVQAESRLDDESLAQLMGQQLNRLEEQADALTAHLG